jgi:hypothetical protein
VKVRVTVSVLPESKACGAWRKYVPSHSNLCVTSDYPSPPKLEQALREFFVLVVYDSAELGKLYTLIHVALQG